MLVIISIELSLNASLSTDSPGTSL